MFDLNSAVAEWRRPFLSRPEYGDGAIQELEDHLRDVYQETATRTSDEAAAFRSAVQRVGTETSLRGEFERAWKELGRLTRYRKLLSFESRAIETDTARAVYRTARIGSVLVGGFCLVAFVWLIEIALQPTRWLYIGYEPDEYFYLQGRLLYITLMMTAVFNLVPFTRWRSSTGDWLRVAFVGWMALTFLQNGQVVLRDSLHLMAGWHPVGQVAEAAWWMFVLGIGPTLWLIQLMRHRSTNAEPRLTEVTA